MERTLIWRQLYYDSQPMDGRTSIPFFTESDENCDSVTSMTERTALQWLFSSRIIKDTFSEALFEDERNNALFFDIVEPITHRHNKPGDVDLILCDKDRPNEAIAFECKRVKITSESAGVSKVNNATALRTGVKQTNGLQSLGFHQSYLLVMLLDDVRHREYRNTMMRNSKGENIEEIFEIPQNEPLHTDAGVIYVKITQPTGKHVNMMAGIGFCIDKPAARLSQKETLTSNMKQLFSERRNAL